MNINELVNFNNEKYVGFKNFCNSIKGYNQSTFDSYFSDTETNNLNIEDKLLFAIESIKDFNINDIVNNFHCHYCYTTVLEYILRTEKRTLISTFINKYLNDIKKEITLNETSYELLTVLYSNLDYDNCLTDTLTPLIFKFESLDFINVINKHEQKLVVINYLIYQKDNFSCSDNFLKLINAKYDEVLQQQEEFIIKKFNESIEYSQILINNLNANKKYKPSEKMKYFETLINTLKV